MSSKTKVFIVGASGETGGSIVNALLATPGEFEITALARESSLGKQELVILKDRGVIVKPVDLDGPLDVIKQLLLGADVVISCLTAIQYDQEISLIKASKEAGVGRYVPSFFGPCMAPRGVMFAREKKEEFLDLIKKLRVPYTAIDIGWWYQLSIPAVPSRKFLVDPVATLTKIIGTGDFTMALTDNRDIGKYVARIIVDPRTLNKSVFAYGEIWTQNKIFDALETLSGETIVKENLTQESLEKEMAEAEITIANGGDYVSAMMKLGMAQYLYAMGIRGDNTPENAKYLGYLDAKELYPDMTTYPLEEYIKDLLNGKVQAAYRGERKQ